MIAQAGLFVYSNVKYPYGRTMDFRYPAPALFPGAVFPEPSAAPVFQTEINRLAHRIICMSSLTFCHSAILHCIPEAASPYRWRSKGEYSQYFTEALYRAEFRILPANIDGAPREGGLNISPRRFTALSSGYRRPTSMAFQGRADSIFRRGTLPR